MGAFESYYTPIFAGEGEDRKPINVPALIQSHTETGIGASEPMKQLGIRVSEYDLGRLEVLAGILNTPRSSLARELLSMALNEAFQTLPDELKPPLDELDRVIEQQRAE